MYQDNNYTIYAVLSRKADVGRQANAVGHLATGLHSLLPDQESLELEDYIDADSKRVASISQFPFVVLSAKNSNQLRTTRARLEELGAPVNAFVGQMVGGSSAEQRAATAAADDDSLEYVALMTFGRKDELDQVFRKFSLYRGQSLEPANSSS